MNTFKERMSLLPLGKQRIADSILQSDIRKNTIIVDLGAGACTIEKRLIKRLCPFDILAIDKKFLINPNTAIEGVDNFRHHFVTADVCEAFKNYAPFIETFEHVIIIMSAILHELKKEKISEICKVIAQLKNKNITLYIREPIIDFMFKDQFEFRRLIPASVLEDEQNMFYRANFEDSNTEVDFVNYCFARSYGEEAWKRESKERRFAFSFDALLSIIKSSNLFLSSIQLDKDKTYKQTLPYDIYDKITHTSAVIIAKREDDI